MVCPSLLACKMLERLCQCLPGMMIQAGLVNGLDFQVWGELQWAVCDQLALCTETFLTRYPFFAFLKWSMKDCTELTRLGCSTWQRVAIPILGLWSRLPWIYTCKMTDHDHSYDITVPQVYTVPFWWENDSMGLVWCDMVPGMCFCLPLLSLFCFVVATVPTNTKMHSQWRGSMMTTLTVFLMAHKLGARASSAVWFQLCLANWPYSASSIQGKQGVWKD